jgi:Ran GTPase-activating protein 1
MAASAGERALLERVVALERRSRDQDDELVALALRRGLDLDSGARELLDGERARVLLGAAVQRASGASGAARLCSKSFGAAAAAEAARALQQLPALSRADLSDIIAGRPEAEALEVLRTIVGALPAGSLTALDLSENALGEKGVRALADTLRGFQQLREAKFMNNGLSELSVALLEQALPTGRLETLHFHNNMSGSGGAKAAAKIVLAAPKLRDFRMSSSRVRADGGIELLRALHVRTLTLMRLNLADSMFDQACTAELIACLPELHALTDLVLRDTGVAKQSLLKALALDANVPLLAVLDLSGLELEPKDGAAMGKIVAARPRLRKLWLDDNELESAGVIKLCQHAGVHCMLETISVQTNQVGSQGARALAKFALASKTVARVDLNDNQIGAAAVAAITKKLGDRLGKLDDNAEEDDPDDSDEDEDEEQGQDQDQAVDDLAAAMGARMAL